MKPWGDSGCRELEKRQLIDLLCSRTDLLSLRGAARSPRLQTNSLQCFSFSTWSNTDETKNIRTSNYHRSNHTSKLLTPHGGGCGCAAFCRVSIHHNSQQITDPQQQNTDAAASYQHKDEALRTLWDHSAKHRTWLQNMQKMAKTYRCGCGSSWESFITLIFVQTH